MNSSMSTHDALERMTPEIVSVAAVAHLHRYALALRLVQNLHALDLACGEGYGTYLLASTAASVIGIDVSPEAVHGATRRYGRPGVTFAVAGADALPLPDSSIDRVVSFETLEHHDRHEAMLSEIKRVLKPDGIVIISTPDRKNYSDLPNYINEYHIKELYRDEFVELLKHYFSHVDLYEQRIVNGSLIYPVGECGLLEEASGNFEALQYTRHIERGEYNLIIAADRGIEKFNASFFDGTEMDRREVHMAAEAVINAIRGSASYRLGHALLSPARWIKQIFVGGAAR